jgi:hypothetical protein
VLHHDEPTLVTRQEEHQRTVPESVQKQEKRIEKAERRKRKLALRGSTEQDYIISASRGDRRHTKRKRDPPLIN